MAQEKETPLARWSRLKRDAARDAQAPKPDPATAPRPADTPPPQLPPLDQLTPDSDFSAFMDPRVDERLRRLALNKLFSDPRLNVVDGLDDFAEDYSLLEDVSQELVAKLEHVRRTLRRPDPEAEKGQEKDAAPEQNVAQAAGTEPKDPAEGNEDEGEDPQDVARGQDT